MKWVVKVMNFGWWNYLPIEFQIVLIPKNLASLVFYLLLAIATKCPHSPFSNCRWHAVASWTWDAQDETCGICRMAFDGCCPDCKLPGDDCPISKLPIILCRGDSLRYHYICTILCWLIFDFWEFYATQAVVSSTAQQLNACVSIILTVAWWCSYFVGS